MSTQLDKTDASPTMQVPHTGIPERTTPQHLQRRISGSIHSQLPKAVVVPSSSKIPKNVVRDSLIAGSCSGMASTLALYPMDVLRTKMQAEHFLQRSPLDTFRHTIQHGGIRALYTGMALPFAAQALYKGTVFAVNNWTQDLILIYRTHRSDSGAAAPPPPPPPHLSMMDRFCCGATGGAVNAALFVTPVEYVRNQLIAQHSKLASGQKLTQAAVTGSWDVIHRSLQMDGVATLWRGISWSVARDGLGCGCFFVAMAATQQWLTSPAGSQQQQKQQRPPPLSVMVLSGASAGLAYWFAALPMDTVKTWIQSADGNVRVSAVQVIYTHFQQGGIVGVIRRLQSGWQVAYGRGVPAAAITVVVYSLVYQSLQGVQRV